MWAACSSENASFDHGHAAHPRGFSVRMWRSASRPIQTLKGQTHVKDRVESGWQSFLEAAHTICVCAHACMGRGEGGEEQEPLALTLR